jgi:hypothetical protein
MPGSEVQTLSLVASRSEGRTMVESIDGGPPDSEHERTMIYRVKGDDQD